MKFSCLSALSVAIGVGGALGCGSSDTSTTDSQGGAESGSPAASSAGTKSQLEMPADAGATNSNAGPTPSSSAAAGTPSPPATTSKPVANASDAGAKEGTSTAASGSAATATPPVTTSTPIGDDAGGAKDGGAMASSTGAAGAVPIVYFQTDVYPILLANCGMTCHASGDSSNGNFDLGTGFGYLGVWEEVTTHSAAKAAPDTACNEAYVINQDPAGSLLYQKITGVGIPAGCGVQMPKGGPYLSAADQETIKNWILSNEALSN